MATSSLDVCKFFFEPVYDADNPPPSTSASSPSSPSSAAPIECLQPKKRGRKKGASLGSSRHRCRLCSKSYIQAPGTGYSNLLTHLRIKHPDFEDHFHAGKLDTTENVTVDAGESCFTLRTTSSLLTSSATSSVQVPKEKGTAGRKRGPVYEHFEDVLSSPGKNNKKMRCVYCQKDTSQISGRLKLHLVAKCPQVPEEVKDKFAGQIIDKKVVVTKVEMVPKNGITGTNVDTSVDVLDPTDMDAGDVDARKDNMDTTVRSDTTKNDLDATAATPVSVAKVDAVTKPAHIAATEKTWLKSLQTKLQYSSPSRVSATVFRPRTSSPVSHPAQAPAAPASPQQHNQRENGDLRSFEEKLTTALVTTNTPWSLLDNAAFREAIGTLRPASNDFPLTAIRARTEVLDRLAKKYDQDCRQVLATSSLITLVASNINSDDGVKKTSYMALDERRRTFVLANASDDSASPYVDGIISVLSTLPATSANTKLFLCAPTSGMYTHARRKMLGNPLSFMGACMTQQSALLLNELVLSSLSLEEALDNSVLVADALHVMPSLRRRVLGNVCSGNMSPFDGDANYFTQVSVTSWRSLAMAVKQAARLEPFLRTAISQEKRTVASTAPSAILRQLLDMGCREMIWNTLRLADQVLAPLYFLSALSELQSTTSGQQLALWIWLFGAATRSPLFEENSNALFSRFMQRLSCYVEDHFISCLILDPRVHGAGLSVSGLRRSRGVTVRLASTLVPGFNETSFIRSYNDYVKQQGDFGEPGVWNSANTSSPMEFWGDYDGDPQHNQLAIVAKAVCSYVPHSCSFEKLWAAHARPNSTPREPANRYTLKEHETITKIRHSSTVNARANAMAVVSKFHTLLDVENEQTVEEMLQSNKEAVDQETSTLNLSVRLVLQRIQDGLEEDVAAMDSPSTPLDATWFDISSTGLEKIRDAMDNYLSAAMQQ